MRVPQIVAVVVVTSGLVTSALAQLVNSEWNTGSGSWNVTTNWFPNDVPDNGGGFTYDVQIGNRPVANAAQVTFVPEDGTEDTISDLVVSSGADFFTNGFQLNVVALTTIDGAGTTIRVDPHATPGTAAFTSLNLNLNNGGGLTMSGGIATVNGKLQIKAGSVLGGYGTVNVGDVDGVIEKAFENSALLQPQGNTTAPQTLTIHANGVDTIDLDGDSETGVVDVDDAVANINADTVTLVIDGPLSDPFGGLAGAAIQIGQRDTLSFTHNLTIAGPAAISMNGGNAVATLGGLGQITSITNATFTITGAALIANDMAFSGTANTITLNASSSLELAGTVTILDASALSVPSSTSTLIISGSTTVTEVTGDFDWDGAGTATTTVKGTGQLTLNVNHVDVTNDLYGGTLNLQDDGDVTVNNVANVWTMAGTLHKSGPGVSTLGGDAVNVSAGTVTVDAGTLSMPVTTLGAGTSVTVNGTLSLGGGSVLAGPTSITGTGTLRMIGSSTVTNNTTVNTSAFDWDGSGAGTLQTINDGVVFTINSSTWDADDAGDMDDPINIGGTGGTLAVNNVPSWTMTRTLTTNTAVSGITSLNGNSRMIVSGALAIWNANGQTAVNAPVTFGASSVANIAGAGFIRLNGGDNVSIFNRIEGATINGPGALVAINSHQLRGFGAINAPITFQNTTTLAADDGTLTIGGAINEVPTIGTADSDGTLNVVNAWNSNVATSVLLNGGVLQGGAITVANANGIAGKGLVSARVVNNTRLRADAGTLVFETSANDNDWDGASNLGQLQAVNAGTLEVRDNATFTFDSTVSATGNSVVHAKGFGFNLAAGSTLSLTNSTFQSDESSSFAGAINVGAGDSVIDVQVNRFLTIQSGSVATLTGNLWLMTNNGEIAAGATFSGNGALRVAQNGHLILDANANVNVLLENYGTYRPSGFNTVGRNDVKDLQQFSTGAMEFEIIGTGLNQYDRLIVNGSALVAGTLRTDIDGGFVLVAGQTFNLISATGGLIGTFDHVPVPSGAPAGLKFKAVYSPTLVQVTVVSDTYTPWVNGFAANLAMLGPGAFDKISDPDHDGLTNFAEFAVDGDPSKGKSSGKLVQKIAPVGGVNVFTFTIPVRSGAVVSPNDPVGGPLLLEQTTDGVTYSIEGSDDLTNWSLNISEVTGADATNIQTGLPALSAGWIYRTFRTPDPVAGNPRDFMRVVLGGDYVNGSSQ